MPSITLSRRTDNVVVLMIDQSESRANVLSTSLWNDLGAAVDEAAAMSNVAGLVIASAKPGIFIAGADLKLLGDAPTPHDPAVAAFIALGTGVLTKLEALPFATIAAIDGAALGGGLEVALACDFRIVGSNPKIQLGLPETTLGLMPGWGGSQRLPRIVGVEVAARMLRTAKSVSAAEAVANDLAVEQVQSDGLIDAAAAVLVNLTSQMKHEARALKSRPMTQVTPAAIEATDDEGIRAALTAMNTGVVLPLEDGLRLENHAFLSLTGTPESKRRISEFFNRKK